MVIRKGARKNSASSKIKITNKSLFKITENAFCAFTSPCVFLIFKYIGKKTSESWPVCVKEDIK